jgi:IS5 family transposase
MLADLEAAQLKLEPAADPMVEVWRAALAHYRPLIGQILAQTERRVFGAESVPAGDKIVSLFEPHADIIRKGGRDVEYGHKLNLTSGKSGLILDVVIEAGNPADSDRFLPMLERHIADSDATGHHLRSLTGHVDRSLSGRLLRSLTGHVVGARLGLISPCLGLMLWSSVEGWRGPLSQALAG